MHNPGQFTPRDTIVLHLYGRYCNASTFAGEVDFFEALDDVKKHYSVDDNRVLVRGFSMGGASAWHIGAHYGTDFAAVAPGAGFAETMDFFGYTRRGVKLTWFEDKLLHLTNATDYAANFFNVPVVAYNGDKDAQKQAADVMAGNMETEGLSLSRVTGLNIGHAYTPDAIVQTRQDDGRSGKERARRVSARGSLHHVDAELQPHALGGGRWPRKTLGPRARGCPIEGDHRVTATTSNVSALSFDMGTGAELLNRA